MDENGVYLEGYDWLTGKAVGEVARPIFDNLRKKGYFYQTETYQHVYPHCWRCKTELIFRLVDEWFISMHELRERHDAHRGERALDPVISAWSASLTGCATWKTG